MSQTIQPPAGPASRPRRRRTWRTLLGIVVVVAVAIGVGLLLSKCAGGAQSANGRGSRPTVTVGTAQSTLGDVPITVTALGTVTPEATVSVISRVTGQLQQVRFTEGQMVRRGDVLAIIDPAPFQAAVSQAQGSLAHDEALLADAKLDLQRYNTLVSQNSIATQTRDTQAALVKQDEGLVASDKGAVATAQLNLQWSRIVSPVAGRVGIRQVDAGNQISANGATPIAVVTQIDPIDVIFAVPEDAIPSIVKHPDFGAGLPVTAYDRAGGASIGAGSLATIDNVVDTTTGTVKGKARFANPAGALFPNQFVNITVLVDTLKNQVIVPTTAVRHGPNGDFVWVAQPVSGGKADQATVKSTPVKIGPGTGETTSIASGLGAGETVITDGGDRLRDGGTVSLPRPASPAGASGGKARHRGGEGGGGGDAAAYGGVGA